MGVISDIVNSETGGIAGVAGEIIKGIEAYLPPNLSPEQKANIQMAAQQIEMQRTLAANTAANEAEQNLNQRIKDSEGTASDLKGIPLIGPILLLLRGAFRPLFSYFVAFMDFEVFSGLWKLDGDRMQSAFWVINFLVLGFFFGERAIQNIMPAMAQFMAAKTGK